MITPFPLSAPRWLVLPLLLGLAAALPLQAAFPNLGELTDKLKKVEGTASKVGQVVKGASGLTLEEEIAVGNDDAAAGGSRIGQRQGQAVVRVEKNTGPEHVAAAGRARRRHG